MKLFVLSLFLFSTAFADNPSAAEFYLNEPFRLKANIQDKALYRESSEDYIAFWEKCAQDICWMRPWDQGFVDKGPFSQWFVGGQLNVSYNCLDRHIEGGKGDKIALVALDERGGKRTLSYQELYEEVNRLANVLKNLGIRKGDRVAIYLPMIPEAIASMLACARIGAVHNVIFGGIGSQSVRDRILDSSAKLLITADGTTRAGKFIAYKASADEILSECPTIETVLVLNNCDRKVEFKEGRDVWYHDQMALAEGYCAPVALDAEDMLFILYTSGTTGKPKGIFHTAGGYLVGVHNTFKWVFDIKPDDTYWCTADIGWITGHSFVVYGPLSCGAKQVIYDGSFQYPDKKQFGKIIEENQVSIFYTAPTFIRMLIQWGDECISGSRFDSLRLLGSIGEPLNPEVWQWYYKLGGERAPIVDTWFQTETGALVISPIPGVTPLKAGSVTQALPGYDIAVLDDRGEEAQSGFLAIRKPFPSMMRGIYNDPDRYLSTYWSKWDGKYYYAGDTAYWDEDGYLWFTGRADEVIKVSGHRIGTAEIENVLLESSIVAEASAIGIKDDLKGQKIIAFVILKNGVEDSHEEDLRQFVASYLGAYARPEQVIAVNKLPKTRSGKILRRVLKNLVEGAAPGDTSSLADATALDELVPLCQKLHCQLYHPVDLAKISDRALFKPAPEATEIKPDAAIAMLQPLLTKHLEETNYDRLHLVGQFLDYYDQTEMSPLEALATFQPDSSVSPYHGSSCYGLTLDFLSHIPSELKGFCVPAVLPSQFQQKFWPKTCHAAVAIKTAEGYILADANFDMDTPICVPFDGTVKQIDMKTKGIWSLHYEDGKILCQGEPKPDQDPESAERCKNLSLVYEMQEFMNPVEVGLKPMMATDRRISLLSRDERGFHLGHINVLLDKKEIAWAIYEVKQPPIPFDAFVKGDRFSSNFSELLHLQENELNDLILKVIQHLDVLNALHEEYIDFIKMHPRNHDFTP